MNRLALENEHQAFDAKFVEFNGWNMPLVYSSLIKEHIGVRNSCGLFDVSHMGKILVSGENVLHILNTLSIRELSIVTGRSRYTHITDLNGYIMDDVIITKTGDDEYLCICNASSDDKIEDWFRSHSKGQLVKNITSDHVLLAIQGPKSQEIIQKLTIHDLRTLKRFRADSVSYTLGPPHSTAPTTPDGESSSPHETEGGGALSMIDLLEPGAKGHAGASDEVCTITSRVGYTGEDGFEILLPRAAGPALWKSILTAGGDTISPIGIGARDTLRLEKGFLLAGADFDGTQTSLETGHEKLIDWDHEFVGRQVLSARKGKESAKLVGVTCSNKKAVPRRGMKIFAGGGEVGAVTSGTMSPSLRQGIALGYVTAEHCEPGTELEIQLRGRMEPAKVVKLPFL